MRTLAAVAILSLTGCTTAPGSKWYAPATWFSHAPADRVDRAQDKEEVARHAVVKAAQRSAHSTAAALAVAPASRPVAVAADSNASAVALLDQAAGPMEAQDLASLRATVAGLLSENAEIRAKAEAQRATEARTIGEVSAALAKAEAKSEEAAGKLRTAYERENALANELRSQRALFWIAVAVAALVAAGWLYARFALGGIPNAVGAGLARLRATNPQAGELATNIFDQLLNRHEQERISRAAR
jgi:hypothetical protein